MSRVFASLIVALGCVALIQAQESTVKSKTEVKGGDIKTMTYSGCLQNSTEARAFILDKVVPVGQTTSTQVGTSGEVTKTITTTYALVPGERVEFQPLLGHKVEVTGMLVPAGKTETETKIERENGPDTRIKEKTNSPMPQFRVTSIKELAGSCS